MTLHAGTESVTKRTQGARKLSLMARRRISGPTTKVNGISLPVHLVEALKTIRDVETEAFAEMSGDSKVSLSDVISWAIEEFVGAWIAEHGSVPERASERREFIDRLAASNLKKLREQLTRQ